MRGAPQRPYGAVDVREDPPRVARELVADPLHRVAQPRDRVRRRAGAGGVEQQRPELRLGVGPARPGEAVERGEQHADALGRPRGRVRAGLVERRLRRDDEAQQILGALGVPPGPEQVRQCARREGRIAARRREGCHLRDPLVGIGLVRLQDPHVLRARRRLGCGAHRREPADEWPVGRAEADRETPQGDGSSGCRAPGIPHRNLRQVQPLDGREAVRLAVDPAADGGVGRGEGPAGVVDVEHLERRVGGIQPGQRLGARVVVAEPPRRHRREPQLLAEQPLAHCRQIGEECRVLEHAGAQPVDDAHPSAAHRLGEARDTEPRPGAEFERIAPLRIDASQDDVDAFARRPRRPLGGLHPDRAVPHHEVAALHERKTERVREERLVERRLGQRAGGEDDDPRRADALGGGGDERRAEGREVRIHPVQRALVEQVGQHLRDDAPVLGRVAEPRRSLHAVGEHMPVARRIPPEVGRRQQQIRRRGVIAGAGHGPHETGVAEDDRGRHDPLAQHDLRPVQVREQRVQQLGPLRESDVQARPAGGIHHERHRVELPRLQLGAGTRVRDAVVGEEAGDLAVDAVELFAGQTEGEGGETLPGGAQRAVGVDDLVEPRRCRGERQRRLRHGRGVITEHTHAGPLPGPA